MHIGDIVTSAPQEAVRIDKGTRVLIMNPKWNDEDPTSQYNLWIEIDSDTAVWTCSSSETLTGKVIEIVPIKPK